MAIWYSLRLFGIVCGHLAYFSRFGVFGPRKVWQPRFTLVPELESRKTELEGEVFEMLFTLTDFLAFKVYINMPQVLKRYTIIPI
jgi:hypothetical protein